VKAQFSRSNHQRSNTLILLLILGLLGMSHAPSVWAQPKTHTVTMEAVKFTPATIEINAGDTVIWVNKDPFPHNVTAADRQFHSKDIEAGASWKLKTTKKGVFPYGCTLHPMMKATLVVK